MSSTPSCRSVVALAMMLLFQGCTAPPPPGGWHLQREQMIREHLMKAGHEIQNQRVVDAIRQVPRHEFVPKNLRAEAYKDEALPIGHGQTISQPYIVAVMTEAIDPQPGDRILEIGTGSGYQAAVLAAMGARVFSIEIVKPLGAEAEKRLRHLGYDQVKVRIGDGYAGWPEEAPFDAVIVTCAPEDIPQPLVDQLKPGGRMIIPVGEAHNIQELYLLTKTENDLHKSVMLPVRFVPMTGAVQKQSGPGGD